jgi:hypothetical protein
MYGVTVYEGVRDEAIFRGVSCGELNTIRQ